MYCVNEISCPLCNSNSMLFKFNNMKTNNLCKLCNNTNKIKCNSKIHSYPEHNYCDFCFINIYNFVNKNLKSKIINDYKEK